MITVVTGATGHIGANLVRALLDEGRRLRVVVREDTRAIDGLDVERVRADVLDPASLERAFEGAETVFHLAAVISILGDPGGQMQRVNVEGVRNVAAACLGRGVRRLVHFSSIHALSHRPQDAPVDERRAPADGSAATMAYDRSKAGGEREIQAAIARGLDAVIVNPTSVLGPHDHKPSLMGQMLLDLYHGRFPALIDGGFDWVDARDVVQGALAAERLGVKGERYLLSGKWAPVRELARTAAEVADIKLPRFDAPMWLARFGAPFAEVWGKLTGRRVLFTRSSLTALRNHKLVESAKARAALGYTSRPLAETLRDAYVWFEREGRLARPLPRRAG